MNIKKIIKEELEGFEWAEEGINLKGYILNFVPAVREDNFDTLVNRLEDVGITLTGNGLLISFDKMSDNYIDSGVHFIFVNEKNRVMPSSGELLELASYMEEDQGWNPNNVLDGWDVLSMG